MRRAALVVVLLLAACTTNGGTAAPSVPSSSGSGSATSSLPVAVLPPSSTASSGLVGGVLSPRVAAEHAGLKPAGAVAGLGFRDANGSNIVVLRKSTAVAGGISLMADQIAQRGTGRRRVLREVRDGMPACPVDLTAEFVHGSLGVRDDDGDGIGEVHFAYRLACRGDVSPAEQKLLVLEDGKKYILRGETITAYASFVDPVPEPVPEGWPHGVYDKAIALFRDLAPES